MPRSILLAFLGAVLILTERPLFALPTGPRDLKLSIETSRRAVADMERLLHEYDAEMRRTVGNDPQAKRRREEIRIIKRYYNQEIEQQKGKIIEGYKRLQELQSHDAGGEGTGGAGKNKNAPQSEAF